MRNDHLVRLADRAILNTGTFKRGSFVPENDPKAGRWYWLDVPVRMKISLSGRKKIRLTLLSTPKQAMAKTAGALPVLIDVAEG